MGSKGGGQEVEQNTVTEPWAASQPFLQTLLGGMQGAYGAGMFDFPTYPGARVAPQSAMTQAGMQGYYDTASGGDPFLGFASGMYGSLGRDGLSGMTLSGLSGINQAPRNMYPTQDMWRQTTNYAPQDALRPTDTSGFFRSLMGADTMAGAPEGLDRFMGSVDGSTLYGGMGDALAGEVQNLGQFSDLLSGTNLYRDMDTLKSNVLADVVPAVSSRFANSGMLDSTFAADTMSRSAAEAVAPIEYGAWENAQNRRLAGFQTMAPLEYGRQENAANRHLSDWTSAQNRSLSGLQTMAPLEYGRQENAVNRDMANIRDAFGARHGAVESSKNRRVDEFDARQNRMLSALGMSPSLMEAQYLGPLAQLQAGQYVDQFGQREDQQVMDALGMAPALSSLRYLDPQMMAMAGGQQDAYGQNLVDAAMATWYEQAMRPYESLRRASAMGLGFGGMGGSGSSSQEGGGPGLWGTIGNVGTAATGIASLIGAFSDRRLKADVEPIGTTGEGYPKYRFRYLWDEPGTERVGVMADEVPEAITFTHPSGFTAVDYSRVTL